MVIQVGEFILHITAILTSHDNLRRSANQDYFNLAGWHAVFIRRTAPQLVVRLKIPTGARNLRIADGTCGCNTEVP